MKISYVMPVYNGAGFLEDTVQSLLEQEHKDFEIVIVNDGSTDGVKFLRDFYLNNEDYKQIVWEDVPERRGGAYCRNRGNVLAKGDIIAVCDCGDLYEPSRGKRIIETREEKGWDLFYSDVQVSAAIGIPQYTQAAGVWKGRTKPPISHPTVAYTKELGTDIRYHERSLDTDLYEFFLIDAYNKGYEFFFVNEILCIKRESLTKRDPAAGKEMKAKMYEEYCFKIPREDV